MAVTSLKQAQAEARKEWERLSAAQKKSAGGYWNPSGFRTSTGPTLPGLTSSGITSSRWTPYFPELDKSTQVVQKKKVSPEVTEQTSAAGPSRFWEYPGGISQIETVTPEQRAVSEAFGSFLTSKIGQGLPRYTGPGFSGEETEAYIEARRKRATSQFQSEVIPGIREAYRGPGTYWGGARAKAEERATSSFEEAMREEETALRLSDRDKRVAFEYDDFLKSLPELNPILGQSLSFLALPLLATIIEPKEPEGPSPWEMFQEMTGQDISGAFSSLA